MTRRKNQPPKISFDAVYKDGVIHPTEPLQLPEDTPLRLTVAAADSASGEGMMGWRQLWGWVTAVPSHRAHLGWILFAIALFVYITTRFVQLSDYPIYFFSDEAIQAVLADDLIKSDFRDADGTYLPSYFKNYQVWNLSLSVYIHLVTVALFGKSVVVTRATSAFVSLFGVTAVSLILKYIFKIRFWWLGILVMAGIPAWFLHSRTAFETVMMVSFYALFILFYLLYRCRSPYYIYLTFIFGAAAFYAYSNGQAVIGLLALLLGIADFRYHWRLFREVLRRRQWRTIVAATWLLIILAVPYLRFRLSYPTDLAYHLRTLNSYWLQDLSLSQKLGLFAAKYRYALSPGYWFFPNEYDLIRHRMKGYYGHIRPEMLPLLIIGLVLGLRRWRSAPQRTVLLALVATPFGAATVDVAITRVLAFVAPASILIVLGLEWLLTRLPQKRQMMAGLACFVLLAGVSLGMLRDALVEGPLWYTDYGLFGMQYGAAQLFDIIPEYLAQDEDVQIMLTSVWANGADMFPRFFLEREELWRVQMLNVDAFMLQKRPLTDNTLFIMTVHEYDRALDSDKFKTITLERHLPYPDGSPGFYFVRLAYADDVDAIFAAEAEARRRPVDTEIQLRGQRVAVRHSLLDMGDVAAMFDGDTFTLGRVMEANPALIEFTFPEPWQISELGADFATMDFLLTISLYAAETAEPVIYEQTYRNLEPDPHIEVVFDQGPAQVIKMRIEIEDLNAGEKAKIHIRELSLK